MKRFFLIGLLIFCVPLFAHAQYESPEFKMGEPIPDPENPGMMIPYQPPVEPDIKPVKFVKHDPPANLRDRVDRLLYGIKVDIPPEYDHYGYEMRRYMAHIGGPKVYGDEKRLKEELANVRKAKIIHKYWRQELMKEISAIEKAIEEQNPSSDVRTSFKYNSGLALAFMTECMAWIDQNEKLLEFLVKKQGAYTFNAPSFTFHDAQDRQTFGTYFIAARKAREYVNEYVPFAMMVY